MIIFEAEGKRYGYPQGLEDIPFGSFLEYLDKILPGEPWMMRDLRQSYIDEVEVRVSAKNVLQSFGLEADKGAPSGVEDYLDWAERRTLRPSKKLMDEIAKRRDDLAQARQKRNKAQKALTDIAYTHKVLPYFARVVAHFTGMPYQMLLGIKDYKGKPPMDWRYLEAIYWQIMKAMQVNEDSYQYRQDFTFEGEEYIIPARFMENGTVIEFMEAAQFQAGMASVQNGNWKAMLDVTAVLLRKPGEQYSSQTYARNKEAFVRLPMSAIVDISFFLLRQSGRLGISFQTFTLAQEVARLKRASRNLTKVTAGT